MKLNSLHDLFLDQLRDIYDAEKRLLRALPKMAKAASDESLKMIFQEHLEETKGQIERLEKVFDSIGSKARAKACEAMKGLIAEGEEMIAQDADPEVKDAGLIAAAQRVEHYEIAAYGTVRTYAEVMGHEEAAQLLAMTEDEEKAADLKLNECAKTINLAAMH